jgi:type I pantothenate kinase
MTSFPASFRSSIDPTSSSSRGLNVLQTGDGQSGKSLRVFVSDFFDFSVYIDAAESDIERWYVSRFLTLRQTVFRNPRSYFHRYASLTEIEAIEDGLRRSGGRSTA